MYILRVIVLKTKGTNESNEIEKLKIYLRTCLKTAIGVSLDKEMTLSFVFVHCVRRVFAFTMDSKVSKADMTELKSLANPPVQVIQVFQAVLLLFGYSERDSKKWICAKRFMADPSFLNRLKTFDPASVSADTRQRAQECLTSLSHENLMKVSMAVCGLYYWAVHMSS